MDTTEIRVAAEYAVDSTNYQLFRIFSLIVEF